MHTYDGKWCFGEIFLQPRFSSSFCPSFSSGVNSFVTRSIKKMMTSTEKEGKEVELFIVGEKGRSQLARIYADVSSFAVARCSYPHLVVVGSPPLRHTLLTWHANEGNIMTWHFHILVTCVVNANALFCASDIAYSPMCLRR